MITLRSVTPTDEQYVKARFAVELDKEELAKLPRLVVGFWTLTEKDGRQWVNPPAMKDKTSMKGDFKPVFWADKENMAPILEKIKEAVKEALKKPGGNVSADDGFNF